MMQRIGIYRGIQFTPSASPFIWQSPRIPARWAREVTWVLSVEGVTNAPTTLSLRVVPQIMLEHSRSQNEEGRFQAGQTPLWTTINPENTNMLLDGAFGEVAAIDAFTSNASLAWQVPPAVTAGAALAGSPFGSVIASADASNGAGVTVISKRVAGGNWQRLQFDLAYTTAGSAPAIQLSLEAVLR